jgi:CubicO group peptidase (beta-lactamase class C family)
MKSGWKKLLIVLIFFVLIGFIWIIFSPPDLFRVGTNYSAKIVCSNVFLAGRNANDVLAIDVQAPGNPFLKIMQVKVDHEQQLVRANLLGFLGHGLAVYREGTGCASVPDGDIKTAASFHYAPEPIPTPAPYQDWPLGSKAQINQKVYNVIQQDQLAGEGWRGIAVIHQGKLIGQRYAIGFNENTPLLGWSMTKTVNAALIGLQVNAGKLALDQHGFWPASTPSDGRDKITVADLLAMSSGLRFNENYGNVSDVTRMLFLEPDMAAFVHSQPLDHPTGTDWNYSTGTSVYLSHIWQQTVGNEALTFPRTHLFAPLGMSSAIIEADARGTISGGSYMYATVQDWARFGQFLLQDGMWNGQQLLPAGYVSMMHAPASAAHGEYGQGQTWLMGPGSRANGSNPDTAYQLPADTYWMMGHDGQFVAIVPSQHLVMVRLGLTPHEERYRPQAMLSEIIKALN